MMTKDTPWSPYEKEILTIPSANAVGFTSNTYTANRGNRDIAASLTIETANVRYWVNGATPTANEGHLAVAGQSIEILGGDAVTNFRAIGETGNATAMVTYFRR